MTTSTFMYEVEIEAVGDVTAGHAAILHAPTERCRQEEPAQVNIQDIWIVDMSTGKKIPVQAPTPFLVERVEEALICQSREDDEHERELHESQWEDICDDRRRNVQ
tara:strand:- start:1114 stop:1431 length:318 start_codon:yes stop_codon:yes gene_type:complete